MKQIDRVFEAKLLITHMEQINSGDLVSMSLLVILSPCIKYSPQETEPPFNIPPREQVEG
jgi:hypothetical protein